MQNVSNVEQITPESFCPDNSSMPFKVTHQLKQFWVTLERAKPQLEDSCLKIKGFPQQFMLSSAKQQTTLYCKRMLKKTSEVKMKIVIFLHLVDQNVSSISKSKMKMME